MISFITTFKPFKGLDRIHQINALKSWSKFAKGAEIIVVGESDGFENVLNEYNFTVRWITKVRTSYSGAPYLDDMLKRGLEEAKNNYICIINGDIIILSDFTTTIDNLIKKHIRFMLTSRRMELMIDNVLDFDNPELETYLKYSARKNYKYHLDKRLLPIDLFVFNRDFLSDVRIPPFVYGRGIFVRWFIYNAHCKRVPAIDATPVLTAIHQTHSYNHITDFHVQDVIRKSGNTYKGIMSGKEFIWNVKVAGPSAYFSEGDFTHVLTEKGLIKLSTPHFILRRFLKDPLLPPYDKFTMPLIKYLLPSKTFRSFTKKLLKKYNLFY